MSIPPSPFPFPRNQNQTLTLQKWLLSRAERAQVDPAYAARLRPVYGVYAVPPYGTNPNHNHNGGAEYYSMHPMPPPVYDPNRPPVYDGPPAGAKVDPAPAPHYGGQAGGVEDYAPPAGPPPGASVWR